MFNVGDTVRVKSLKGKGNINGLDGYRCIIYGRPTINDLPLDYPYENPFYKIKTTENIFLKNEQTYSYSCSILVPQKILLIEKEKKELIS